MLPQFLLRLGQRGDERWAIHRMDHIEQGDRLLRFVGLQLAHQMEFKAGGFCDQRGPFAFGFLHSVFAKHALSSRNQRPNRVRIVRFGNGDQRDIIALAPGELGRVLHSIVHRIQAGFCFQFRHGGCYRQDHAQRPTPADTLDDER